MPSKEDQEQRAREVELCLSVFGKPSEEIFPK